VHAGDDKGDEEAEYAWLPYDNIKPFALGDVSGNNDGQAPADPVLLASVAAAEAALRAATAKQQQAASRAGASGFAAAAAGDATDEGSDSDGGWGVSREVCGASGANYLVPSCAAAHQVLFEHTRRIRCLCALVCGLVSLPAV
jgi:hypothetical protein